MNREKLNLRGYDQPPARYRFLTRSFVEGVGLEDCPMQLMRNRAPICIGTGGILPPVGEGGYAQGVVFEGHSYVRERDGLAYRLVGTMSVLSDV